MTVMGLIGFWKTFAPPSPPWKGINNMEPQEDYENYGNYSQEDLQELSLKADGKKEKTFILDEKMAADIEVTSQAYSISESSVVEILIARGKKNKNEN